ncbi:MAG: S-layer homology domain-containing protein, partial [Clostridia bacterium]|nr:S-layer homology domain-containing protein [Clostridia bacterium]
MKKIISALIAVATAVSTMVPVMAKDTFSDVNGNYAWAKEYVEDMAERGLISGYTDGTYRPGIDVSRMDAFSLFARLLGSNNEANEEVVGVAKKEYESVLKDYKLTYAEDDIAFLLYRGIITEKELDKYFAGTKKTEAMPRYEAAILITKAMLAEDEAGNEVLIDMDYTDVSEIPKEAKQYVYYVTQKGIMSGTGDEKFSPNTPVQRGQIAVMLSKTANSANYYFEVTKLEDVDPDANNIKISDYDAEIGYSKDTVIFKDGEIVEDSELLPGQTVVLTYSESDSDVRVVYIDIVATEVTDTLAVIYKGYSSSGGTLTVSAEDPVTGDTAQYECSPNAIITIGGEVLNINKVKAAEYVTLGFAGDVVIEITSLSKTQTIRNAKLTGISPEGKITISHEDKEYDGMTYAFSRDVNFTKDGDVAEFS